MIIVTTLNKRLSKQVSVLQIADAVTVRQISFGVAGSKGIKRYGIKL